DHLRPRTRQQLLKQSKTKNGQSEPWSTQRQRRKLARQRDIPRRRDQLGQGPVSQRLQRRKPQLDHIAQRRNWPFFQTCPEIFEDPCSTANSLPHLRLSRTGPADSRLLQDVDRATPPIADFGAPARRFK